MAKDYKLIASDIYKAISKYQITNVSMCMTRLRVSLKAKPNLATIKKIDSVLDVIVSGNEYQFVLGPGIVKKVYTEFNSMFTSSNNASTSKEVDLATISKQQKEINKEKRQSNFIAVALSKFAKIFTPLIPAFIAAGILAGIAGILQSSYTDAGNPRP
jgi:N-acetylmuramic acid-specific PTS system IIC component